MTEAARIPLFAGVLALLAVGTACGGSSTTDARPLSDAGSDIGVHPTGDASDVSTEGATQNPCDVSTPEQACQIPECRPRLLADYFKSVNGSCGYFLPDDLPVCSAGSYCPAGTECTSFDTTLCIPDAGPYGYGPLRSLRPVWRATW